MADEVGVRLSVANRVQFSRDMAAARGDVDKFGDEVDSTGRRAAAAGGNVSRFGRATKGLQSSYRAALGPSRAFGLALGGAVGGIAFAARQGWTELTELNKVEQQTAARMESTGGVANVSAKYIRERSMALENLTTIDENVIGSAQNMLLTFTKVRNEVGEGNKIFDRATEAGLNLAAGGFGTPETAAKMLGKALNDPIKGMTAMSRAGVTFTQKQTDSVKAMVESNNILGAQKLILNELETQVGGSAKAYGDSIEGMGNRVRDAFGDLSREGVRFLIPIVKRGIEPIVDGLERLNDLVTKGGWAAVWEEIFPPWLNDTGIKMLGGAIVGALIPAVIALGISLGGAALALAPWMAIGVLAALIITNWDTISRVTKDAWNAVKNAISDAWSSVRAAIGDGLGWITDNIATFVEFWFDVAGKILTGAEFAFGWIPGIGDKIGEAKDRFNEFTDAMVVDLRHQADQFRTWEEKTTGSMRSAGREWDTFTANVNGTSLAYFSYVPPSMPDGGGSSAPAGRPQRAFGGPVMGGLAHWVGERGVPEVFVPKVSGTIIAPDLAMAGGGGLGRTLIMERGAVVVQESGDPERTYKAVKQAVSDAIALN